MKLYKYYSLIIILVMIFQGCLTESDSPQKGKVGVEFTYPDESF